MDNLEYLEFGVPGVWSAHINNHILEKIISVLAANKEKLKKS